MQKSILLKISLLLASCSSSTPWHTDSIATGDKSFDSTKLSYQNPASHSPLHLELLHSNHQISCFLNLKRFQFHSATVQVQLKTEDALLEESLPVGEGKQRLRLSDSLTTHLLSSLQEGKKVSILVDGFEETFLPDQFQKNYKKWTGNSPFFTNLFKGPIE